MNLTADAQAIAGEQPMDHATLNAALVAALESLTVVEAGRTANAGTYSYDYADLGDIVKLTRPVLARHGLVALTPIHDHGSGLACTVLLLHSSGDRLELGPFPFPHGRDAQATGSAVTYHRRYSLLAALGMATGEDDDGAAAVPAPPPVVWNANTVKQALTDLCDGDKAKAKRVWDDSVIPPEFFEWTAKAMFDAWENQPADDKGEPT